TPASFEASIEYVVTKVPRFNYEKFPQADATLTTQMKSVAEVMAIGRNFQESVNKALRGLEVGSYGFGEQIALGTEGAREKILQEFKVPGPERIWYVVDAFSYGFSFDDIFEATKIDRWFLIQIYD